MMSKLFNFYELFCITRPLTSVVDRSESDQPQNEAEEILFEILNRLFPNLPIKLDADFFDDLGGHSLLAAVLISNFHPHVLNNALDQIHRF